MKEFDEFFEGEGEKLEADNTVIYLEPHHENWKGKTLELLLISVKQIREYGLSYAGISSFILRDRIAFPYINLAYDIKGKNIILFTAPYSIQLELNKLKTGNIIVKISEDGKLDVDFSISRIPLTKELMDLAGQILSEFEYDLAITASYEAGISSLSGEETYNLATKAFDLTDDIIRVKRLMSMIDISMLLTIFDNDN